MLLTFQAVLRIRRALVLLSPERGALREGRAVRGGQGGTAAGGGMVVVVVVGGDGWRGVGGV